MKYINAKELLPSHLFEQVQKYAGGNLLYVPQREADVIPWGEKSGYRKYMEKRNRMMVNKFRYGISIRELAMTYCLSEETVKKIVYSSKLSRSLVFSPGIYSAKEYEQNGFLEEWIHTFLLFERKNIAFSEGLLQEKRFFTGPVQMERTLFRRSSGPEEDMKWRVDETHFENNVKGWQNKIRNGQWESIPPVIIGYEDGMFEINCGNPLFEALCRENISVIPVIIWITKPICIKNFQSRYMPTLI